MRINGSKVLSLHSLILPEMIETRCYAVAGHIFSVTADGEDWRLPDNYAPFLAGDDHESKRKAFSLVITEGARPVYAQELIQEDHAQAIICGTTSEGWPVFEFQWSGATAGWLICSPDYRDGRLIVTGLYPNSVIDNALMVMYALATAAERTVLFHAAVVSHGGRGYMFLGPSGTGKSTHAALWQRNIEGAQLVNDDNPVVRIGDDGRAMVYGSPWSGKTPCYRNVAYPLGGIVALRQAPYNRITRISGIRAYAVLLPGISGKRWDRSIADGLHDTENTLVRNVPVWTMECLPDKEAALICEAAIAKECDDRP